jgi:hypothetical protein
MVTIESAGCFARAVEARGEAMHVSRLDRGSMMLVCPRCQPARVSRNGRIRAFRSSPRGPMGSRSMMKTFLILFATLVIGGVSLAEAQNRPQRPPWQDVCCGGPCCAKPQRPGR